MGKELWSECGDYHKAFEVAQMCKEFLTDEQYQDMMDSFALVANLKVEEGWLEAPERKSTREMREDAKVGIIQLWLDELSQDYVCSTMIYKEAFDHEYDTPKDWELKEINNVMNNSISGWEKISSHRFAEYGIQRGWRRIADKEEFHKLPEHAETPFDKK